MLSPPSGYQFKTQAELVSQAIESLLDTGAAFGIVADEVVTAAVNRALDNGLTAVSDDWPLLGLQRWPEAREPWRVGNAAATTLSVGGELPIIGAVILNLVLVALDGRRVRVKPKLRIVAASHLRYYGLVIGGPTLEAAPLGWGFKPAIGAHVFAGLGISCIRLEDALVQQAAERGPSGPALWGDSKNGATCSG